MAGGLADHVLIITASVTVLLHVTVVMLYHLLSSLLSHAAATCGYNVCNCKRLGSSAPHETHGPWAGRARLGVSHDVLLQELAPFDGCRASGSVAKVVEDDRVKDIVQIGEPRCMSRCLHRLRIEHREPYCPHYTSTPTALLLQQYPSVARCWIIGLPTTMQSVLLPRFLFQE